MMRAARIAPIWLGCCPTGPRCMLCNPPPPSPGADLIEALLSREDVEGQASVPFFIGGPPPTERQVEAAQHRPFMARVRPDLLGPGEAERLVNAGVLRIELDVLSFEASTLRRVGRDYTPKRVREIATWFRERGVEVSTVLAVGLPGTHHFDSLRDAKRASEISDLVRLHPVLVLDASGLRDLHHDGRYEPLDVSQAVTTCDAMMRLLESEEVEVIRVGQNPVNDQIGRAVAGPMHPALRELVESKRMLRVLHEVCGGLESAGVVRLRCAREDEGRVRGPSNAHLREVRSEYGLKDVRVEPLQGQARGEVYAEVLDHDG